MRVRVRFNVPELDPAELGGTTAVVIDVLRATSTIAAALAAGARGIYPTASTEDALHLAQSLGRDDTLLCGERKGLKIEGYELGNSPLEFTSDRVEGKRLVMNTTNGTRAFLAVESADRVYAAALVNSAAVAERLSEVQELLILCAGRQDAFALEDAVCAGHLVECLRSRGAELELDDAARAAATLARAHEADAGLLAESEAGRLLAAAGLSPDLEWCARRDILDIVPEMIDRSIVLSEASRGS